MTDVDRLTLELGEGFSDAEVLLLADGETVWHQHGVTTNYSVGLADVVQLPDLSMGIEVRIRDHHGQHSVAMSVSKEARRLRVWLDPAGEPHGGPAPEGPLL